MTLRSLSKSGSVRSAASSLPSYRSNVGTSTAVDAPPPRQRREKHQDHSQSSTDQDEDDSALSDTSALSSSSDEDDADSSRRPTPPPRPRSSTNSSSVPAHPPSTAAKTTTKKTAAAAAATGTESLPPASRGMTALSPWSKGLRGTKHDAAARWTRRQAQSRHHFIIVRFLSSWTPTPLQSPPIFSLRMLPRVRGGEGKGGPGTDGDFAPATELSLSLPPRRSGRSWLSC